LDEEGIDYKSKGKLKKQDYIDLLLVDKSDISSDEKKGREKERERGIDNEVENEKEIENQNEVTKEEGPKEEVEEEERKKEMEIEVKEKVSEREKGDEKRKEESVVEAEGSAGPSSSYNNEREKQVEAEEEDKMVENGGQKEGETTELKSTTTIKRAPETELSITKPQGNDNDDNNNSNNNNDDKNISNQTTVCIRGFIRPVNLIRAKQYILSTLTKEKEVEEYNAKAKEENNIANVVDPSISTKEIVDIWMNSIKSTILLTFTTSALASYCISSLNGKRWPDTNPNRFTAYLYPEDVQSHRARETDTILPDPKEGSRSLTGKRKREEEDEEGDGDDDGEKRDNKDKDSGLEDMEDVLGKDRVAKMKMKMKMEEERGEKPRTNQQQQREESDDKEKANDSKEKDKEKEKEEKDDIPEEIKNILQWGKPLRPRETVNCKLPIKFCPVDAYIVKERKNGNWIYTNPFAQMYDDLPTNMKKKTNKPFRRKSFNSHNNYNNNKNQNQHKRQKMGDNYNGGGRQQQWYNKKRGSFGGNGGGFGGGGGRRHNRKSGNKW